MKMQPSTKPDNLGLSEDARRAIAEYDGPITTIPRGTSAFDYSQTKTPAQQRRFLKRLTSRQIRFQALNRRQELKPKPKPPRPPAPPPAPKPRSMEYIKMAKDGHTARQIADHFGVRIDNVRKVLRRWNVKPTPPKVARLRQLRALVKAGKLVPEIAEIMETHRNEIYRLLKEARLRVRPARSGPDRDKKKYARLEELAGQGHCAQEIADHFGIDRSQVYRMAQRLKITLPTQGKGPVT